MSDVECPYCGEGVNINHDDGAGYAEGETHHEWCKHCDRTFSFTTSIIYSYDALPAPCIDDENVPHEYDKWGWCNCGEKDPNYKRELKHE